MPEDGDVYVNYDDGQMYVTSYWGLKKNITRSNFVSLFKPVIKLNGNYNWNEKSMLTTLVHEMCHYYTYMEGKKPRQGHGPEFRRIAGIVSKKSKDFFTIQRLANAEVMADVELDSDIVKHNKEKLDRKKSKLNALLFRDTKGNVCLTMTSSEKLINTMYDELSKQKDNAWLKRSNDKDLINTLYKHGFNRDLRTLRHWVLKPEIIQLVYSFGDSVWETLLPSKDNVVPDSIESHHTPKKFRLKIRNDDVILDFNNEEELFNKIKERHPGLDDEVIRMVMRNKSNYITEKYKSKTDVIIESVVRKFINEKYWMYLP